MKRFLILGLLIMGLLGACSQNRRVIAQNSKTKPSHASLYFFFAGVYNQQLGNYDVAEDAFRKALTYETRSYQIRKHLLLNSIYRFDAGQIDLDALASDVEKTRERIVLDEQILHNLYNSYLAVQDTIRLDWTLRELEDRYPTGRIHFLRFVYDYRFRQSFNLDALARAEAANPEPDVLLSLAQTYDYFNPSKALELVQRYNQIEPNEESLDLELELILNQGTNASAITLFQSYRYPADKDRMNRFLEKVLGQGSAELILKLQQEIFATEDPKLYNIFCLAALFSRDKDRLGALEAKLAEISATDPKFTSCYAALIADAIIDADSRELEPLLAKLYSVADYETILSLYLLVTTADQVVEPSQYQTDQYEAFLTQATKVINDSEAISYLVHYSKALRDLITEEEYLDYKKSFARILISRGKGGEGDFTLVVEYSEDNLVPDESIALMRRGIELYPESGLLLNSLGYALLFREDALEEGGMLIHRAVEQDPENDFYLDSLAWYYYLMQDYDKALFYASQIKITVEQLPSEISYHLGMIFLAREQYDLARYYLDLAALSTDGEIYPAKAREAIADLLGTD